MVETAHRERMLKMPVGISVISERRSGNHVTVGRCVTRLSKLVGKQLPRTASLTTQRVVRLAPGKASLAHGVGTAPTPTRSLALLLTLEHPSPLPSSFLLHPLVARLHDGSY
jgi:hypothetical protein